MNQQIIHKLGIAAAYAFLSSVALNFFWLPGKIYASGITGLSQLLSELLADRLQITLSIPTLVLLFNLPLLVVAWRRIDRSFTIYTIFAVLLTSFMMKIIPVYPLTTDPVICGIFGGALHGLSVGLTLNSDFSTGGLDIIGILVKKATKRSIGSFFIVFNICLQFFAGWIYGWQYAFYSALSFFISGQMVDYVNAKQKRVQLMIVTESPTALTASLQTSIQRGITVINDVEGAFDHHEKKLLLLVISQRELKMVKQLIHQVDEKAFISIAPGVSTNRTFFEW
ncbi:YitT family protein [Enterococcus songbeiensis]|uniref:YitT family protein n=1 Tax=Enterococcus songbeiensis TaxID=2559927 RepID=UPI0010F63F8E|nr:YitT family protein [Enterococcus songbeiensis]